MNATHRIGFLFGSHGDQLLERYRSCDRLSRSLEMLASEIRELQSQRTEFHQEHGERLETLSATLEDLTRQRQSVDRELADAQEQKQMHEQSIENAWKRWIVWLKHLLVPDTLTVDGRTEAIERLASEIASMTISSQDLASEIHQFTHQCQRLAIPLESYDFAIDYLQQQFASDSQQLQQQHQAIDLEIRTLARSNTPRLLHMKGASPPMLRSLLNLKDTLLGLDALKAVAAGDESIETNAGDDYPTPPDNLSVITEAIRSGFSEQSTRQSGKLFVEGRGTTHVRKTRSVTETYTDANGNPRTRSRNESYWAETAVDLVGSVEAKFDVEFSRWDPTEFLNAIHQISSKQFHLGMNQVARAFKRQRARREQEAEQLTAAIRREIELSLGAGSN